MIQVSSLGAVGRRRRTRPASCTDRSSLRLLHGRQAATTFSQTCSPPRLRGMTWSMFSAAALPEPGAIVHAGALCRTQWSRTVCFAGLGPGEVTLGGAKVVGMAQRRTRAGALFQCAALRAWDPARLVTLLGLPPHAAAELSTVARGVDVDPDDLLARLP